MVQVEPRLMLLLALTMAGLWLLGRRVGPGKRSYHLLSAGLAGLLLLCLWNLLAPVAGRLGVNPLSMLAAGTLGLPGLFLLLVCAAL